jgi:hypothetical protein
MRVLTGSIGLAAWLAAGPAFAGAVLPSQTPEAVGQVVTVCGVVVEGRHAPGAPTLLYLADPRKAESTGFAILIRAEDRPEFTGSPEKVYLGKRVCVTGMVRKADGLPPHIAARGEWQIEDVGRTEKTGKPSFGPPQ